MTTERRRLMDAETEQTLAGGQALWRVRVELPSRRQAVELAEWLRAEAARGEFVGLLFYL